ncbi:MAG: Rieske 2Fe-2S domain-containing protein [Acidimicrobiia bacterium]
MSERTRIGSASELQEKGRLIGKVGTLPVVVVWLDGEAFAIEDRCPHLGFPLHQGTFESGMVTCHWHHARFDLASGCTLDPWADDATAFGVSISGDDVFVDVRPPLPVAERWERRLRDGLEHDLTLVLAKAVQALLELPDGQERILRIAYDFGDRNRAEGWGSGMTVLTCMANLLPHLAADDRPLAMVHALRFLANDVRGHAPRFAQPPLGAAGQPTERLAGWYRRFVETRSSDGAERALVTAIEQSGAAAVEAFIFAAATDHVYIDGGHTLDFTNKAFEALGHLGDGGGSVLTSLVAQTCEAERSEESSEWNHPIDLRSLAERTEVELSVALAVDDGDGGGGGRIDVGALGWTLLADEPHAVTEALVAAARAHASAEELARAVAFAAALRLVRFHLNNDPGDWDTVHHTFTYANAVHQAVVRCPAPETARGIVHGALRVYLDRFLNVPAARLPTSTSATLDDLAACWDVQGAVEAAGDAVAGFLRGGGARADLVAALGHALLQEDAGFHWYQSIEAGVRQASAWPERSEEAMLVLVGVARFLAAHTPTRRELVTISRTAVRLRRGEELFADA